MKISVVTTVYNVEKYIGQCLSSIVGQTYPNLEIIIVDDCGTDGSMTIVDVYAKQDKRIKVLHHEKNMGAGHARRTGIEACTGDYIITVDGDDWLGADFIEKLVENAKETDADIVSGGMTIVHNDYYHKIERFMPRISEGMQKFLDYSNQKIVFLANKIIKKRLFDLVPYSTRRFCEDTPVILPMLYWADKVSYVDTQGYFYRQNDASLCHRVNSFENALFKALCSQEMQAFFADKGPEYQGLISRPEYVQYLATIKATMTPELEKAYRSELGELTRGILGIMNI